MSLINNIKNVDNIDVSNIKTSKKTSKSETNFSSYLGETATMDEIFQKAADTYDVPVTLLKAIGKAESNFNPNAVSSSGAQGVMQLMPATAKYLGVEDSFDPEENIMGGSKYISQLLKKYDGNTNLALAAYNAGMGNVAKYGGIPPFKETQNYVVKVNKYCKEELDTGNASYKSNDTVASNTISTKTPIKVDYGPSTLEESRKASNHSIEDLNKVFSYEDYMNFLDNIMEQNSDKEKEEEYNYYASKQINYNIPVLNLIKSISIS